MNQSKTINYLMQNVSTLKGVGANTKKLIILKIDIK